MTNQAVGAFAALCSDDKRPAKFSMGLTVMHHIQLTRHYGGQGGNCEGVYFITVLTTDSPSNFG